MLPNKKEENKRIGRIGEGIAQKFLENKGFFVLARNYKRKFGEVDIIAQKGRVVHFVEVKSVRSTQGGDVTRENGGYRPEELVHPGKMRKISMVANEYMAHKPENLDFQIDVVAVFIDEARRIGKCRFSENVN
ncbi:YraN family protein [Candidatus Kaiserbacteria bacterium]|nr:YraN family protein [Candidatus Kaiserbacteria bacterium]